MNNYLIPFVILVVVFTLFSTTGVLRAENFEVEVKFQNEVLARIITAFIGVEMIGPGDNNETFLIAVEEDIENYLLLFHKLSHSQLVSEEDIKKAEKRESEINKMISGKNKFQQVDDKTLILRIFELKEVVLPSIEVIYDLELIRKIPALDAYLVRVPDHSVLYRELIALSPVVDDIEFNIHMELHE